jgi:CCR4-NOT transcription complex subunit 1
MVTAKDPVRMSIGSHLRSLLMASLPAEMKGAPQTQQLVDQAIQVATADNLALACAFIEKTAMERAVPEVMRDPPHTRTHAHTTTHILPLQALDPF